MHCGRLQRIHQDTLVLPFRLLCTSVVYSRTVVTALALTLMHNFSDFDSQHGEKGAGWPVSGHVLPDLSEQAQALGLHRGSGVLCFLGCQQLAWCLSYTACSTHTAREECSAAWQHGECYYEACLYMKCQIVMLSMSSRRVCPDTGVLKK